MPTPPAMIDKLDALTGAYKAIFSDVWGVVHNGVRSSPEACAALARARDQGLAVVLITNAPRPNADVAAQLRSLDVPPGTYDALVTSGDVTRDLIAAGPRRIFHVGSERELTIYDGLDVEFVDEFEADAVVCTGLFNDSVETPDDYSEMLRRFRSRDLPFICANPDIVVERGDTLVWCAGALARDYGQLGGRTLIAGKPHRPIYDAALKAAAGILGRDLERSEILAIGDGVMTDVKGAEQAGIDVLYVSAGIHAREYGEGHDPDLDRLAAFLDKHGHRPVAVIPRLRWAKDADTEVRTIKAAEVRRVSDPRHLSDALRGGVAAIGNFDGVHRGHQAVLERALGEARSAGIPAIVLTFEPHPRSVIRPDIPLFRLTPAPMKASILAELGFDAVVELPFTRDFASQSAEEFVERILDQGLAVSHVVTGVDFHFGKDRQGGPAFLMEAGKRHGFGVTLVDAFRDEAASVVSSSRIRTLLAEGDPVQAAGLLGYRYTVEAKVSQGRQLGRTLGYPTANMALPADTGLAHGIYAVRFRRPDGALNDGVASFGRRPTVEEDGAALLETYLFDFAGDLYGKTCRVYFFSYLRGEERFDGLDPLVAQMRCDEEEARAVLAGVAPLSPLDAAMAFRTG